MVITRYNETIDARATTLKNNIGAINTVVGVNFSHPSGVIRLNDFTQFTHFTATFEGTTYVYKITNWSAINNGVCELTYELDFLKDYFLKKNWSDLTGAVCGRSTNINDWMKYLPDDKILCTGEHYESIVNTFGVGSLAYFVVQRYPYRVGVSNSGYRVYAFLPEDGAGSIKEFVRFAMTMLTKEGGVMYKQIERVYIAPFGDEVSSLEPVAMRYIAQDEDNPSDVGDELFRGFDGGLIQARRVTDALSRTFSATTMMRNFIELDMSKYVAYVPFIGNIDVPVREMMDYDEGKCYIKGTYKLIPITGECTFTWDKGVRTEPVLGIHHGSFPEIPLPTGSESQLIYNTNAQRDLKIEQGVTSALTGLLTGVATGNPLAALGGAAIAGVGSAYGAIASNKVSIDTIMKSGMSYGGGSSNGADGFFLGMGTLKQITPYSKSNTYYEDHCGKVRGFMVNKNATDISPVGGNKYWLDTTDLAVGGSSWYKDGVRRDLGSDYIYYNK